MRPPLTYTDIAQLPPTIPVFPLGRALLLPRVQLPLNIFEPRYLDMVNDAMASHRIIGMIQPNSPAGIAAQDDRAAKPELYTVGCAGRMVSFNETRDNRILVALSGVCRFRISQELDVTTAYRKVEADYTPYADDLTEGNGESLVTREGLIETVRRYCKTASVEMDWDAITQTPTELLVNSFCMMSPYGPDEKQAMLEAVSLEERNQMLIALTEMALAELMGGTPAPLQ